MKFRMISGLLLALLVAGLLEAQDKPVSRKKNEAPQFVELFDVDFGNLRGSELEIVGKHKIAQEHLTLQPGAIAKSSFPNFGLRWLVSSELIFPKLEKANDAFEAKIWFDLDPATDPFLKLKMIRKDGKVRSSLTFIDTTGQWDTQPEENPMRESIEFDGPLENGTWQFSYNDGLMWAEVNGKRLGYAYVNNRRSQVKGLVLQTTQNELQFKKLSVAYLQEFLPLSDEEKKEADRAKNLASAAARFWGKRNIKQGLPVARQAYEIRQKIFGKYNRETITSMTLFSLFSNPLSNTPEAISSLVECKELCGAVVGPNHPELSSILVNLGVGLTNSNKFDDAEKALLEASRIVQLTMGKETGQYGSVLANLGFLYQSAREDKRAQPFFTEALALIERTEGRKNLDYIAASNNLAGNLAELGQWAEAEKLYLENVQIIEELMGRNNQYYITIQVNLASFYRTIGKYRESEAINRECLKIVQATVGKNHPYYIACLNNFGSLYLTTGALDQAETLFLEAKQIAEKVLPEQHPYYSGTLTNLATVYFQQRKTEAAIELLLRAIELKRKTIGANHPDFAVSVTLLADIYKNAHKFDVAERFYLEASRVFANSLGKDHPNYIATLSKLGSNFTLKREYDRAEELFFEVRDKLKLLVGTEHPDYSAILAELGELAFFKKDYQSSADYHLQSVIIQQKNTELFASFLSESQQLNNLAFGKRKIDAYLSAIQYLDVDPTTALELTMNRKGQVQLRQTSFRKIKDNPKLADAFKQLQQVSQRLYKHINTPANRPGWQDQLKQIADEKERIENRLTKLSNQFAQSQEKITRAQVEELLPPATAFVNFYQYTNTAYVDGVMRQEPQMLAFVVRRGEPIAMLTLGDVRKIDRAIDQFRTQFTQEQFDASQVDDAANVLRTMIWKPLQEKLGDCKTVFLSPDGKLGSLPLGALPGENPNQYLLESYAFLTIPVPKLIKQRNTLTKELSKILLVGDVNYGSTVENNSAKQENVPDKSGAPRQNWSSLVGTKKEVESIRELATQVHGKTIEAILLTGENASETNFKKSSTDTSILHIATHGFFANFDEKSGLAQAPLLNQINAGLDQPRYDREDAQRLAYQSYPGLLSGLVFANANQPNANFKDDGIITAEEICALPLRSCTLATLSACETGLGKVAGGEGMLGLQRAFQIAGADSVVASLWKVDDFATQVLMERFYQNVLEKKLSKLEALVEAQRWVLRNPKLFEDELDKRGLPSKIKGQQKNKDSWNRTLHVRRWAAWTLAGDWQAIR